MHTADSAPMPALVRPLVGVFDSGVGGLSVLRALRKSLPHADLLYVADSGNAPYGERTDSFVIERAQRITEHLVSEGAVLLVIACNTATAVAAQALRAQWPQIPIVGVEPGLKPALAVTRNRRLGVMATPMTLKSEKFRRLLDAHAHGAAVTLQPCPGLAAQIERGDPNDPVLLDLVNRYCQPLHEADVDTVVLGCTHYPFVSSAIEHTLGPGVALIDTADAVARQAARLLPQAASVSTESPTAKHTPVRLLTTGETHHLARLAAQWLDFDADVSPLPTR